MSGWLGRWPRRARLRWLGVALLIGAAGLAAGLADGWWAWPRPPRPPVAVPGDASALPAPFASPALAADQPHSRPLAVPAPGLAHPANAASSAAAAVAAAPDALARCRAEASAARAAADKAPLTPDAEQQAYEAQAAKWAQWGQPGPAELAQLQAAWDATAQRLQGAPGVQQQAAALLMNRHRPNGALQATVPWSAANLSQLVALALGSADPVVLQWAVRACGTPGQNPSCQGLSARAWPDAEPGNLLAWLALLSDEPQAREEALQGMVQATRAATTWARPAVLVQAARPADLSPGLRLAFELHLVGLALADVLLPWGGLLKTCSDAHLADPLRRGQCQVIAQRLVDRGQDLITVGMGNAMGKRLGWPAQRDQDHQALVKAGVAGALDLFLVPLSPDCQARVLQHHWQQVDSLGEVEMARQQLRADALAAGAKASASAPGATAPVR